ncbi:aldolase/citrate lyase family protein [Carboxylicivirga linearis]|uniref:HpcH/HpaI aldolase/citrate lyase family protein n=1 Tax=Carboxylicivirga linearis TaxID=1628157 RepID=A0ABS5JYU7_9BACT|nr:aldolase/citrate lyase family protein [Carboxylicivirga linearis]MBS2099491.1 HpcH/HpaI aldolase/citrate lyase family protein [Carboxylicivirga linearis]
MLKLNLGKDVSLIGDREIGPVDGKFIKKITMVAHAGNKGDAVRSDCFVNLELKESGGIIVNVKSKVDKLYGNQISKLSLVVLQYFSIKHAVLTIDDKGALPFVIAARIEAVVHQLIITDKTYLTNLEEFNKKATSPDRIRRSRLYLPGNNPKLMLNAGIYGADGIILDLEDSVAPDKKDEARILVRNALRLVNFYGAERMVRINQLPLGLDDLDWIAREGVNLILIPKCESAEDVHHVEERIQQVKKDKDFPIHLMPIIESALGVQNAYAIASASENVVAIAIGLEDYTADIGAQRTNKAKESFFARSTIVNAAKAAGKQAIDSVFSDIEDMDALSRNVTESKSLGFTGMGCIHPRQIIYINQGYAPNETEIEKAKKIVNAFLIALENGSGVVALGSKMIDPPVVKRAQNLIDMAISTGQLAKDWRNVYV